MPTIHLKRSIKVAGALSPGLFWSVSYYDEIYKSGAALASGAIKGSIAVYRTGISIGRRMGNEVADIFVPDADKHLDGYYVGGSGATYLPSTPFESVPAALPSGKTGSARDPVVYVNGIRTSLKGHARSLRGIADQGLAVVGIYNASGGADGAVTVTKSVKGVIEDLGESLGDKLDWGDNKAVDTLTELIYQRVKRFKPIHIIAHSQGALIASRAINHVIDRLAAEKAAEPNRQAELQKFRRNLILQSSGLIIVTDELVKRTFAKTLAPQISQSGVLGGIKLETYGGAAYTYPDGPRYIHYYNKSDLFVPMAVGQGAWFAHPGRGAVIIPFDEPSSGPIDAHSFDDIYLHHRLRQSFDEVYQSRYRKLQEQR